jgi:hypothetical protein
VFKCAFCNSITNNPERHSTAADTSHREAKISRQVFVTTTICGNVKCRKATIIAYEGEYKHIKGNYGSFNWIGEPPKEWRLQPEVTMPELPSYIKEDLRKNFEEAHKILLHSSNASAVHARRCLQYILNDYFSVELSNLRERASLKEEIDAVRSNSRITPPLWAALDAVRIMGNVGAHPDVNVMVDVNPEEVNKMLEVIHMLIEATYVLDFNQAEKLAHVVALGAAKKAQVEGASNG